jgi:hypothetical protein
MGQFELVQNSLLRTVALNDALKLFDVVLYVLFGRLQVIH